MAKKIVKKLKSSKFLGILYTLKVILPTLTELSKIFPTEAINISSIMSNVLKTKNKLH